MNKIIVAFLLVTMILVIACSKDDIDNEVPTDPFTELNLPEQYFNYANIQLPSYYTNNKFPEQFQFQAVTEYDNTPIDNPNDMGKFKFPSLKILM